LRFCAVGQDAEGDGLAEGQSWYWRSGSAGPQGSIERTAPSGSSGEGDGLGDAAGAGAVPHRE
jgi:hypothetical protein